MTGKPDEPKDEIPAFRISDKKVDDSWKEEVRREREAAAKVAVGAPPPAAPRAGGDMGEAPHLAPAVPGAAKEKPAQSAADQQQSKIFMTFLAGLAQQALMQLGDIPNPFSGQQEVDLQGARYTVELLNTLRVKTKGNLTEEEDNALEATIHDLRIRFVEVANEVQRQMQAQAQKGGPRGAMRPGPGGTIPGPGSSTRR